MINNVEVTNGVCLGAVFNVSDTTAFDIQFVGVTGFPVDYPVAISVTNGTFTENDGVFTITPTASGRVDVVATRAREYTL